MHETERAEDRITPRQWLFCTAVVVTVAVAAVTLSKGNGVPAPVALAVAIVATFVGWAIALACVFMWHSHLEAERRREDQRLVVEPHTVRLIVANGFVDPRRHETLAADDPEALWREVHRA